MGSVIQVVDANSVEQNLCVASPNTPVDKSGTIQAQDTTQILLDAVPAGFMRGAWWIQNRGQTTMQVNELGGEADDSPSCVDVAPGQFWPPPGYPVSQAEVSVKGVVNDQFAAREWLTPVSDD